MLYIQLYPCILYRKTISSVFVRPVSPLWSALILSSSSSDPTLRVWLSGTVPLPPNKPLTDSKENIWIKEKLFSHSLFFDSLFYFFFSFRLVLFPLGPSVTVIFSCFSFAFPRVSSVPLSWRSPPLSTFVVLFPHVCRLISHYSFSPVGMYPVYPISSPSCFTLSTVFFMIRSPSLFLHL